MKNTLVSVIVLSYKNLKYYRDCLDSILSQNYNNIELIFSDDGTPNFNEMEIKNYIDSNKRLNLKRIVINHNNTNIGIVKNYNKAIKMSKGKYIFYVAMDDMLWDENTLVDVVNYFEKTKCLIFTGYRVVYDETMKNYVKTSPLYVEVEHIKNGNPKYLYEKLCKYNFISGGCTPFSRELINRYGYLDEAYVLLEDYPRYLSLTRQNCRIYFIDRPLIKYRLGGITKSEKKSEVLLRDEELVIKKEILPYHNKS